MYSEHDEAIIQTAIARFPSRFALRGFPGRVFKIMSLSSFVNDAGAVMLYTYVLASDTTNDTWLSFAKGTEAELRANIVSF